MRGGGTKFEIINLGFFFCFRNSRLWNAGYSPTNRQSYQRLEFGVQVPLTIGNPYGRIWNPRRSPQARSPIWASPSQLSRLLARSCETRFTRPNRRACSQATHTVESKIWDLARFLSFNSFYIQNYQVIDQRNHENKYQ